MVGVFDAAVVVRVLSIGMGSLTETVCLRLNKDVPLLEADALVRIVLESQLNLLVRGFTRAVPVVCHGSRLLAFGMSFAELLGELSVTLKSDFCFWSEDALNFPLLEGSHFCTSQNRPDGDSGRQLGGSS